MPAFHRLGRKAPLTSHSRGKRQHQGPRASAALNKLTTVGHLEVAGAGMLGGGPGERTGKYLSVRPRRCTIQAPFQHVAFHQRGPQTP